MYKSHRKEWSKRAFVWNDFIFLLIPVLTSSFSSDYIIICHLLRGTRDFYGRPKGESKYMLGLDLDFSPYHPLDERVICSLKGCWWELRAFFPLGLFVFSKHADWMKVSSRTFSYAVGLFCLGIPPQLKDTKVLFYLGPPHLKLRKSAKRLAQHFDLRSQSSFIYRPFCCRYSNITVQLGFLCNVK